AEAHLANFKEAQGISFHEAMLRADEVAALGPKPRATVKELGALLVRAARMAVGGGATDDSSAAAQPAPVGDLLKLLLDETGMIEKLRAKRDPQDDARAENLEELVAVAREFDAKQP